MKFSKVLLTSSQCAPFVLRLFLGLVFMAHGWQLTFGGGGLRGSMQGLESMGIPALFAFAAIMSQLVGGAALIAGVATRVAAAGIFILMVVAVVKVHLANGFFMNWYGEKNGEGYEYHLLAIGAALSLLISGGGRYSIDIFLTTKSDVHQSQS